MTTMNDRSGYFLLTHPKTGWTPCLCRCGLFAGERASAYTYVDEIRFRIIESPLALLPECLDHGHLDRSQGKGVRKQYI
jgi:hypothetical protein